MKIRSLAGRTAVVAALAVGATPLIATAAFAGGAPPSGSAPAQPTIVSLTSGNRDLGVSWTETSTGRITFTATATATGEPTRVCHTMRDKCKIVALKNGVTYTVSVVAKNAAGSSAASATSQQIVGIPGAPLSVHATAETTAAAIHWAPPKASGVSAITQYVVTATDGTNVFQCTTTATVLAGPARTCTITGLTTGTKYTVTVTAANKYGVGPSSKSPTVTAL